MRLFDEIFWICVWGGIAFTALNYGAALIRQFMAQ
jgi:hypothetical protein